MSPAGALPLGQLLSNAYQTSKLLWKPILIGAVVFGTVMALTQGAVGVKTAERAGSMMQEIGIDTSRMEELSDRMQAGDDSAADEMQAILQESLGGMDDEILEAKFRQIGGTFFKAALPAIGIMALIGIIVGVISHAYFLVLALGQAKDAGKAGQMTLSLALPLLGVWVWSFLRSFAWIPVVGIVTAIVLGPRFALAPVILVKEKKGVLESVSLSYGRTNGYWGKIVGNIIVMALCLLVAGIVLGIVASILGAITPILSAWILAVGKYVFTAFAIVFIVQLSATIMNHPMGVVPVKAVATKKTVTKKKK